MPAIAMSEVMEKLRAQPEQERLAWLRWVFVEDDGVTTNESLVRLALAMAEGRGIAVPGAPAGEPTPTA